MSYLNEDVAGKNGFIKLTQDGEYFVNANGDELRFWAVNGGEIELTDDEYTCFAKFLAKRAVNMIRFHGGIQSTTSDINAVNKQLANKIWRLVAAMKKEGIYVTISPYWSGFAGNIPASWELGDYVCVSGTTPKEYDKLSENSESITDNRGNKIELTKVDVKDKPDYFLHVKSQQKQKKEKSIDEKLTKRLEADLQNIKDKLAKPCTLKKAEKIHEKVGRIKAKLSKVGWLYDIKYTEDKEKGIITNISWERIKERERPKGEYFLRYTKTAVNENDIWQVYNMTRQVEAVFRTLKQTLT